MKRVLLVTLPNFTPQMKEVFLDFQRAGNEMYLLSDGSAEVSREAFTGHFKADLTSVGDSMRAIPSHLRFDGIVTDWIDRLTPLASLLCKRYGCIGNSPEVAYNCRSKHRMRQILRDSGIQDTRSLLCKNWAELQRAIRTLNGPCVAKPVGTDSSSGVFFIPGPIALKQARENYESSQRYLRAQRDEKIYFSPSAEERILLGAQEDVDFVTDYLVEEFIEGTALSIDSLVQNGHATIMGIAEQIRMLPPYFIQLEERMPFLADSPTLQSLSDFNQRVISAFGITDSPVHLEVRLGPDGPKVIEIACRFGGDNIHDAVYRTTGHKLMAETIKISLGETLDLNPTPRCHVAMSYILPKQTGRFHSLEVPTSVRRNPAVTEIWENFLPGTPLAPPPDCYDTVGYLQVKGSTREAAEKHLRSAVEQVSVRYLAPEEEPLLSVRSQLARSA